MRLRRADACDLAAVRRITEAAFAPYVPRIGMRPVPMDADHAALIEAGAVHVAEDAGIAGYCTLRPEPGHLVLDVVAVDPARRGQGVGGQLIAFAEAAARERGLPEVRLYTHRLMTENIAMYRHLGYREVDGPDEGIPRVHVLKPVP